MNVGTQCRYCERPRIHSRAATCGSAECRAVLNKTVRRNDPPPPLVYRRNCNRCDRFYEGPGRLLCNECRNYATNHASQMMVGVLAL